MPPIGHPPRGSFVSVSQTVARLLQQRLADGTYPANHRLPSQRDLAESLRVSRPSMREAILMLETLGLLRTEPGRGTFVVDPDEASPTGGRVRWHPADCGPEEVFQTRLAMEPVFAASCAMRGDPQLPRTLAAITDAMEAAWSIRDLLAHAADDFRFHTAIATGSGNALLARLYGHASELVRDTQRVAIPVTGPDRMVRSLAEHRAITAAIAAGDAPGAGRAMADHIRHTVLQSGIAPADLDPGNSIFPPDAER